MSNRYRALTKAAEAAFSTGEFEADFTVEEEQDWLNSGLLELVPRTYRVLTDTKVNGCQRGETFQAALLIEPETALIQGGHIERVDTEPAEKPRRKQKEANK